MFSQIPELFKKHTMLPFSRFAKNRKNTLSKAQNHTPNYDTRMVAMGK